MSNKSDKVIPKALHMVHYYYPSSGQALCHVFVTGSHLLPSQLPGEHTGHEAASRQSKPIWNAHYSSTHHACQVPILHLGDVRHTWSSHLAQGCFIAATIMRFISALSYLRYLTYIIPFVWHCCLGDYKWILP